MCFGKNFIWEKGEIHFWRYKPFFPDITLPILQHKFRRAEAYTEGMLPICRLPWSAFSLSAWVYSTRAPDADWGTEGIFLKI